MTDLFELIGRLWSRVFVFVIAGWVFGRLWPDRFGLLIRRFMAFSIYGVVPVFVWVVMWNALPVWDRFPRLAAAVLGVLAAGAMMALFLARLWREPFRNVCLPVVFMNSIYLALPVNAFVFGEAGAAVTVVFNLVVTIVHFSLGVWWVRRAERRWWNEIFGIPILYAALAGVALNALGVPRPPALDRLSRALSAVALPTMLVLVGIRIGQAETGRWRRVWVGAAARLAGGAAAGWALTVGLGLTGLERGVVILTAAMPSAVNTYVLAERFESNPAFAAAMVTATTAASLVVIPLLAFLLR